MAPSTPTATVPSPLLDKLPPEIRNTIYRLVLIFSDGPIKISKSDLLARKTLVDTCKQIRDEAKDLIVLENEFHVVCGIGEGMAAARWLASLGGRSLRIKKLSVTFQVSDYTNNRLSEEYSRVGRMIADGTDIHSKEFFHAFEKISAPAYLSYGVEALTLGNSLSIAVRNGALTTTTLDVQAVEEPQVGDYKGYCLHTMYKACSNPGTESTELELCVMAKRIKVSVRRMFEE